NWNFVPDNSAPPYLPCNGAQTDGIRPDRYIQNWQYGGEIATNTTSFSAVTKSYFMRSGAVRIDYQAGPGAGNGASFRNSSCAQGVGTRNESSDDYNRVGEWMALNMWTPDGNPLREHIIGHMRTNMWFNYTRVWDKTNYVAYLRGGAG